MKRANMPSYWHVTEHALSRWLDRFAPEDDINSARERLARMADGSVCLGGDGRGHNRYFNPGFPIAIFIVGPGPRRGEFTVVTVLDAPENKARTRGAGWRM